PELEAHEPPEARGLARDEVRLMVAWRGDGRLEHARFRELPRFLRSGDLLVVNNSGTLPASLAAVREDATGLELHLSTPLPSGGREWPVSAYQTVFAIQAGSAEMPSAGRAFTPEMITQLIALGVDVAPVTLHTGVSSLEAHERPPAEFFHVPDSTARRVNAAV